MTDLRNEMDSDLDQNYSLNSNADPKNMQELTVYVSTLKKNTYRTEYNNAPSLATSSYSSFYSTSLLCVIRYKIFCRTFKTSSKRCRIKLLHVLMIWEIVSTIWRKVLQI